MKIKRADLFYSNGLHLIFWGKLGVKIAIFLHKKTVCSMTFMEDLNESRLLQKRNIKTNG